MIQTSRLAQRRCQRLTLSLVAALLTVLPRPSWAQEPISAPAAAHAEASKPEEADVAPRSPRYGGTIFDSESTGVSVGFHRWLGDLGPEYGDCIGAILMVVVDDPWAGNHLLFGAVFNTAVGRYGNGDDPHIFAAAATVARETSSERTVGPTAALPPLSYSFSYLAARGAYRLRTDSFITAEASVDLGYGLLGLANDAQANLFAAIGANLVVKIFPTLIMTLGLQYRQDLGLTERIAGFKNLSGLAIFNSFELVKF